MPTPSTAPSPAGPSSSIPPGAANHGAGACVGEPIYAEAVRRGVAPGTRRRLLVETDAEAPATFAGGVEHALRRIEWSLECGITPSLDDLLRAAAASWHRDLDVPARLAGVAVDLLDGDDPRRVDALTLRGQARRGLGRVDEARRDLDEALVILARLADPAAVHGDDRFRRAVGARAEVAIYNDLDPATGHRLLGEAAAAGPPEHRGWFERQQLIHTCFGGGFPEVGDEVCRLQADPGIDGAKRAALTGSTIVGLALQGRVGEAMVRAADGASLAEANADRLTWVLAEVHALWFTVAVLGGHLAVADQIIGRAEHADRRPRIDRALDQIGAGMGASSRGRWREALAHFRAASVALEERDQTGLLSFALAQRARAAAAVGEEVEAWQVLDRLETVPLGATAVVEGIYRLLCAEAMACLGSPAAIDRAWVIASWAADRGDRTIELRAVHLAVTAGSSVGAAVATSPDGLPVAERMDDLAASVDAPIAEPLAEHVRAVLAGDDARTPALLKALADLGVWIPHPAQRDDLNAREHEVATLAATGMRSKDIAATLYLSVRTVDTHLARIYRKLGINRRDELGAALAVLRR